MAGKVVTIALVALVAVGQLGAQSKPALGTANGEWRTYGGDLAHGIRLAMDDGGTIRDSDRVPCRR